MKDNTTYLSVLDSPRKNPAKPEYFFSNDYSRVEITLSPIIREEELSSDSEQYAFLYFLFLKRPKLITNVVETSEISGLPIKLSVTDRKSIDEILDFIFLRCFDTKFDFRVIRKDDQILCYEFCFTFRLQSQLSQLPTILLEEFEFEAPSITFNFYPRKGHTDLRNYVYPMWILNCEVDKV